MSRSLSYLRRGLLGLAFVGSLGFGATHALAEPQTGAAMRVPVCPTGAPYECWCDGRLTCQFEPYMCHC